MLTTDPTWKPQVNRTAPHGRPLSEHPAVQATLRGLSVVAGAAASALAFVIVGAYAALQNCEGDETQGLCAGHAGLVPVLEWPIFVIAALAPLAGGIASCATRRPRWLGLGVALAFVMFGLMSIVSTGQTSYDWN